MFFNFVGVVFMTFVSIAAVLYQVKNGLAFGPQGFVVLDEPGVRTVHTNHLVVRATLHDLALIQNNDLVAVADGAQAMGNNEAGTAAPADVVVNHLFGNGIE